jgi:hypothetical protein
VVRGTVVEVVVVVVEVVLVVVVEVVVVVGAVSPEVITRSCPHIETATYPLFP